MVSYTYYNKCSFLSADCEHIFLRHSSNGKFMVSVQKGLVVRLPLGGSNCSFIIVSQGLILESKVLTLQSTESTSEKAASNSLQFHF